MKKVLFSLVVIFSTLFSSDYEFDFDDLEQIETKSYEYNGYLKGDYKYQIKDETSQDSYLGEVFLNYKYFKDKYTLNFDFISNYENINTQEEDTYTVNQAFINYKHDENHQIYVGKKIAKWGKGYYFNPVGFIDRIKDPNDPEATKEGYTQLNYKYNKVLNKELQNISFDAVYLRTTKEFNDDIYEKNSNIIALKTYMLYKNIDFDLVYLYSDKSENKIGVDFSTNIKTNFEVHAEFAKYDNGYSSYLLGFKYLTQNDLTVLSEYYYQKEIQEKNIPFWDNRYFLNSITQKEPFDILYFSIYYKNSLNINDNSFQNRLGVVYTKIKNLNIEISISKNTGDEKSEFGTKQIEEMGWLSLKYSF
ncbi:MAG: hypothetical protein U9Q20_07565 [Campylobacterota bacterium]|nr:hypothetical protein [Campylobacterota bacterium]